MKTCPVCDTDYPDQHHTCPTDGAVLIVSQDLADGCLVRGKYRILRKLGQGGMGVVYLAEHNLLGGRVALKFLSSELGKDPKFIKRFRMEARAAYQLRHPNIVEVTDLDQAEDGSLFIAMEYVDGSSLSSYCGENEPILQPVERSLRIAHDIASGLATAHAQGTVHRDIKPENILLSRGVDGRERAKILDFGIAAMAESITRLSLTNGLLLTPNYAAPEQWLGMPSTEMDGRTDLYALGCVLYWMLTCRSPFHAHNAVGWMRQHLDATPSPPSQFRAELANWPGLDALVLKLLAKERDLRHKDASELLSELEALRFVSAEERRQAEMRHQTVVEPAMVPAETILELPPKPHFPEPQPSAKTEEVIGAPEPERTEAKPAPRPRRRWFGTPATAAAAQPGTELGRLYVAGWILLSVGLIARGVLWLLPNRPSPDSLVDLRNYFHFFVYFVQFTAVASIGSGLGIAASRRTRRTAATLGAIVVLLDVLCRASILTFFVPTRWWEWWELAGREISRILLSLGLCGAALMISGLERLRKGRTGWFFPGGRYLFAVSVAAFIAVQAWNTFVWLGSVDPDLLSYLRNSGYGLPSSIWWGTWLAYLFAPAIVLASICILFQRWGRRGALALGAATVLYIPLFCAYWLDDLNRLAITLILTWLVELGLGGGALALAAALAEKTGDQAVPPSTGRIGKALRRRWVRWATVCAGVAVAALVFLHGIAPRLLYDAIEQGDTAGIDTASGLYKAVRGSGGRGFNVQYVARQAHACESGDADGCSQLGNFYKYSSYQALNSGRDEHFYAKAAAGYSGRCDRGDPGGCYAMGNLYREGLGVNRDKAKAAEFYAQSCDHGGGYACRTLGYIYRNGDGVGRDLAKTEAFFLKACKNSPATDCEQMFADLGDDYYNGDGVPRNYARAGALLKKACGGSVSLGCSNLFEVAYAFDTGKGVATDHAKAVDFYSRACDGGVVMACTDLGVSYHNGEGVAQDYSKAAAFYSKGCDGGEALGCSYLGDAYRYGTGVGQDSAKAKQFLQKGCNMGNQWGCDKVKEMH